jgi:thiol-disulfide isomerase/thioredoxin
MPVTAHSAAKWLPRDFVEASEVGGVYTLIAYVVMIVCFFCELSSFLTSSYHTALMLDMHSNELLQINFDVDFYDIECRNLKVSVFAQSTLEPLSMMTKDFWLRSVDSKGRAFGMAVKPDEEEQLDQKAEDAEHEKHIKQLKKEDGAAEIDADWSSSHDGFKHKSFEHVIEAHDFTLINFFAEWCSHCRQFHPMWDKIAKSIHGEGDSAPQMFADRDGTMRGVRLIKMNCVDFGTLCNDKGIDAYPTLRLYKADGTFSVFEGRRDEAELVRWIERTVKMKSYGWAKHHEAFERGCNAKGRFQVPRVPGHLELTAGGGDQNLNPRMTNVSHKLNHLSFSSPEDGKYHRKSWAGLPHDMLSHVCPIDGTTWATMNFHEAYVHDIKVVSTVSQRGKTAYQFSHTPRLSRLPVDAVPQAQFYYDIEPFSINVTQHDKKWYDFCTSLMAIIGGCYVVIRLMSRVSRASLRQVKKIVVNDLDRRTGHNSIYMD